MSKFYPSYEFNDIILPIISNKEYQRTKNCIHHGLNRYDHMIRVAYYSYKITKFFKLDYISTTRAALLHDFFFNDDNQNKSHLLISHPNMALNNSLRYFELNEKEEDIIKTHMFPIGNKMPKYIESWIVDLVDDIASFYERFAFVRNGMTTALSMISIFFLVFIKRW